MPLNNFLPFATGGGANVETQSAYAADPDQPVGNQPGVATSAFVNKALRQGTVIASQVAQFMANKTGTDILDDTNMVKLLAQMYAAFDRKAPVVTTHLSGTGNHNLSYKFQVASANATIGATYSDGTTTFTVTQTIAAGLELVATGAAAPIVSGTLTKSGGTGDATIVFYAVRAPIYLRVRAVGAGGGSAGGGTSTGSAAGAGGNTTFGTTLLVANGGGAGVYNADGSAGGTASLGTGPVGIALQGGYGGTSMTIDSSGYCKGGDGGVSAFGGAGAGGVANTMGVAGITNSGSGGGGGASGQYTSVQMGSGSGGGAGGFLDAIITSPLSTYAFAVGAAGTAGGAGATGQAGAAGGSGMIEVTEYYQ